MITGLRILGPLYRVRCGVPGKIWVQSTNELAALIEFGIRARNSRKDRWVPSSRSTCTSLGSKSNWPRGGSGRGRATIWDAYRGVPSDVADTEEGVHGKDRALLHPNMISVELQQSPFFGQHVCEQACGPSGMQIGVPIHTLGHVKQGWQEDGCDLQDHTSGPSPCRCRLLGCSRSFFNGHGARHWVQWG